ncbi:YbaK/EbsC family protein [Tateyamaria sp. ANG-S1]|uniref:YbaK/EbsC family protein n=1 Tax=Tateyamaria sp. ANG-S1 TaxID=1577905 RepID=UPI00057F88CD|nr:YbaK/EbsC family protein [Tateyamaria sp. ANG-S1]KIC49004.1 prolyl-tRNA synthetase [Tateyamaria sp. ANG-S1]
MSKSLKRVRATLEAAGIDTEIMETPLARTAADAATAIGCEIDQIAKSIIFRGEHRGTAILFITAGGNTVDTVKATEVTGEALGKADAALIRAQTGFAIGGVAPVGHINPIRAFFDPRLSDFDAVWAAAGTPHHVFRAALDDLLQLSGAQISDFTS